MRSRCHHRPLNRHAIVGDRCGCETALGRGHNASSAAAIAAASSSLGAGVIDALTIRPYRRTVSLFLIARVLTIMSWKVRFSESHNGQRKPR